MPGKIISEKILSAKSGVDARAGDVVVCRNLGCVGHGSGSDRSGGRGDPGGPGARVRADILPEWGEQPLLPVVCDTRTIGEGDRLALESGWVRNLSTGETAAAEPLPAIMLEIIGAGGLTPHFRKSKSFGPRMDTNTHA